MEVYSGQPMHHGPTQLSAKYTLLANSTGCAALKSCHMDLLAGWLDTEVGLLMSLCKLPSGFLDG